MTGVVFDIREMTVHDGDGVRVTVFMKGCPLRCKWCHNPEGLARKPQLLYKRARCTGCGRCRKPCEHEACKPYGRCLVVCPNDCLSVCGKEYSVEELTEKLLSFKPIFDACGGGVTFSGGEPLLQSEFVFACVERLKGRVHTAVETCGFVDERTFLRAVEVFDAIIMDLKLFDSDRHKKCTGVGNECIKANFLLLQKSGKKHLVRTPLIKGETDDSENLEKLAELIGASPWERLPENPLAQAKKGFLLL